MINPTVLLVGVIGIRENNIIVIPHAIYPNEINGFLLFNLSDHHPEKMVVAVAIIADKITIKVVDK